MRRNQNRQAGVVLFVSLIMLLLITLFAITIFQLGKGNQQIVGNMQQHKQAVAAAQGAIEQVISSTLFTSTPTNALPVPCNGAPNTKCVSVNGSSTVDINVTVTPTCVAARIIPTDDPRLDWNNPNDLGCQVEANQNFGVSGVASKNSLCAATLWDVQAVATDTISNAQAQINQGAAVRVPATTSCP